MTSAVLGLAYHDGMIQGGMVVLIAMSMDVSSLNDCKWISELLFPLVSMLSWEVL